MTALDRTHDPALVSWVESANDPRSDFPIQNLPFGVFRRRGSPARASIGVAIGDAIVDLEACLQRQLLGTLDSSLAASLREPTVNALMALGSEAAREVRFAVSGLLQREADASRRVSAAECLVRAGDVEMLLPATIGDYSDFYASIDHATNVGSMFRPDNPLLPNYKWVPIGYHGRASSIVVSGTDVVRPCGQTREGDATTPSFGPTKRLDYELEIGVLIGAGNDLGSPIPIREAERHVFGLCLLNDWSARDIQTWEYQPLGPFLAKSFATTISPWVVTLDALAPFRVNDRPRPPGDPQPLPYLRGREGGGAGITLEVSIATAAMRDARLDPVLVSRGSFADMYWTVAQLVAHHASNGCNLRPGDLLGSGTVSGATKESRGCLLERTWRGTEPIALPTGEARTFLLDGDEIIMRGFCERGGFRRIGFGECRGRVLPARSIA